MLERWIRRIFAWWVVIGFACTVVGTASAQSASTNYKVNEYMFGTGGELNACSTSYCSKQAAGETTVGETSSDNYTAHAGFNTTDAPLLEVAVNGSVDFGVLSQTTTGAGTATIQVRTYLATGYVMRLAGTPLSYTSGAATHTIATPNVPTASTAGTEQFGVNLRANTNPITFGADTVQVPDASFSFGRPMTNYNTPNLFMYVDNDPVAISDSSSGQTNYTLSMIANVANYTPAGRYTGSLSAVVTSTF